jgi:hypothetical protein
MRKGLDVPEEFEAVFQYAAAPPVFDPGTDGCQTIFLKMTRYRGSRAARVYGRWRKLWQTYEAAVSDKRGHTTPLASTRYRDEWRLCPENWHRMGFAFSRPEVWPCSLNNLFFLDCSNSLRKRAYFPAFNNDSLSAIWEWTSAANRASVLMMGPAAPGSCPAA